MGWKNYSSWLKGGIIGGLVGIGYNLLLFFLTRTNFGRDLLFGFLEKIFRPISVLGNFWCDTFIFPRCLEESCRCSLLIPKLIFIFLLIFIGILIGWIYGKIKAKSSL